MARRRKQNDPRTNHGKYASDSAPKNSKSKATADSKPNNVATSTGSGDANPSGDNRTVSSSPDRQGDSNPPPKAGAARAVNDPEWYARDTQLVIDAASLPFSEPLGDEVKLQTPGEIYATNGVNSLLEADANVEGEAVPGVMTLFTKSTFGNSRYAQDPANVAANALYTHVRYVNSGRKNYDPADLFMFASSMADVYSFYMWCSRIYAKAFLYSQRNKYIGNALLQSEYLDPSSFKLNLANFRYWLNTFSNKISSFAVPASISYYQRRAWIYAHLYLENPDGNIKDQMYQFSPDGFYRFELDSSGAGMLKYSTLEDILGRTIDASNPITYTDIINIGDWLLENITGDEDFGLMSGDILKAFNGEIIGVPSIPEVVDIVPVYSEYVLLQIKNSTPMDISRGSKFPVHYDDLTSGVAAYCGNVYQNSDGNIWSMEGVKADGTGQPTNRLVGVGIRKIFDVNTPTPTPIDVMEISRLTIGGYGVLALPGMDPVIKISCGADVVVKAAVFGYDYDNNGDWTLLELGYESTPCREDTWFQTYAAVYKRWNMFKYAPILYSFTLNTGVTPNTVNDVHPATMLNNYTIVDWRIIARLHEVALLSMLWVPGVAKVVNF